jgi:hypothetical protein
MSKIVLDFYSGSHGHFLEYVTNRYIFQGPRIQQVLTDLGTSHNILYNNEYQSNRKIAATHFTEFNIQRSERPKKVVRISLNSEMEKLIYQINVACRVRDVPLAKQIERLPESVQTDPIQLRNNFFAKLSGNGYPTPTQWLWSDVPAYEFSMKSFYNLYDFYRELKQLSDFLEHSFEPDESLTLLWHEFIEKNQGWQCWNGAQQILVSALGNDDREFEADIWTKALLNYFLSNAVGLYDGELFESEVYPTNAQQIYALVQKHLKEFDERF